MTPILSLAVLRFGLACAGSLLLAFALVLLLRRAGRRWPALFAHRSVWLAAQAAVVIMVALSFAPVLRSAVAPTLTLPAIERATASGGAKAAGQALAASVSEVVPDAEAAPWWNRQALSEAALYWLPAAWLVIYFAGLAWTVVRRVRSHRQWQRILASQTRVMDDRELRALPAMTSSQYARIAAARLTVRTTGLPVSPMINGVHRPCLLLPAHVLGMEIGQQRLIIEHELTHWRRADPLWLAVSGLLAMLFWFNRPFQRLNDSMREAVELGCDDAVLAGRGGQERHNYAAALVAQLRFQLTWQQRGNAPAFGYLGVPQRVERMREAYPARLSRWSRVLVGAAGLGMAACAASLTPAISAASLPDPAAQSAAIQPDGPLHQAPAAWRYPLDQVRVTSLYGVRSPIVPNGHNGVDFAARRGTPVHAVAAGTIVESSFNPRWGNYVRVDHGGGRSSLLIHLERSTAVIGQRVAAGDSLGTAGDSGKTTGPHLHLEYWEDGRRLDPELMLADLSRHATAKALARRQSQHLRPVSDN